MAKIQLENVSYIYSPGTPYEIKALDDVSVDIDEGKITGIIGHTGSGKSTFVQLLNGLEKPMAGRVLLDGKNIWEKPREIGKIRFRVGLVMQYPEYQLFEETIRRDIAFGPRNMGLPEEEVARRVEMAADFVGLDPSLLDKSPFDLSGGQKRRVAIAGIIACDPKIIVLDEPTAGLDPKGAKEMTDLFVSLNRKMNKTIIIVSHDNEMVYNVCDETVVLSHGKIVYVGDTLDLFNDPKKLKEFDLLEPQIVTFRNRLTEKGFRLSRKARTLDLLSEEIAGQVRK